MSFKPNTKKCSRCLGTGSQTVFRAGPSGSSHHQESCPHCSEGYVPVEDGDGREVHQLRYCSFFACYATEAPRPCPYVANPDFRPTDPEDSDIEELKTAIYTASGMWLDEIQLRAVRDYLARYAISIRTEEMVAVANIFIANPTKASKVGEYIQDRLAKFKKMSTT